MEDFKCSSTWSAARVERSPISRSDALLSYIFIAGSHLTHLRLRIPADCCWHDAYKYAYKTECVHSLIICQRTGRGCLFPSMVRPSYAFDLKALIKGWQDDFTREQQWPEERINVLLCPGSEFTSRVPGGWCTESGLVETCLCCTPKDGCIKMNPCSYAYPTSRSKICFSIIPLVSEELLNTCNGYT